MALPHHAAHRWALLAGIALASLNLRFAVTSIAPLLGQVRTDVGLTPLHTSLLAAAPPMMFAICGVLAVTLARRIGLERSLIVSLALAGAGTVGRSLTHEPATFLGWTVVATAGLGLGNILIPPLIKRYFPERIALVTTTYTLCLVIGQALPPVFILPMANALGWRTAVGLWAVVAVVAAVPWLGTRRWWRNKPTARGRRPAGVRARQLWRSPITWGIATMLGANAMGGYCLMGWLPQVLIDSGYSVDAAGGYFAAFTLGCLFGATVAPPIIARTKHVAAFTLGLPALWLVGLVGLALWPTTGTFWWIAITRVGDSSFAAAMTLMNLRTRRPETVVALSGMTQAFSYVSAAVVSFAFGALHAATGAWTTPLLMLTCVLTAFGVVGALLASRPVMVEDAIEPQH